VAMIMAVDDDPSILYIEKDILQKAGHEIVTASGGKEALAKLEELKPDLILLDIMMPDMDGWHTLELIRKNDALKDVPVSMLSVKNIFSNYSDIEDLEDVEELIHYINKPFSVASLTNDVNHILESLKSLAQKKEKLSFKIENKKATKSWLVAAKREQLHKNLLMTLEKSLKNQVGSEMKEHINKMIIREKKEIAHYRNQKQEIEDIQLKKNRQQ